MTINMSHIKSHCSIIGNHFVCMYEFERLKKTDCEKAFPLPTFLIIKTKQKTTTVN